MPLNSAQKKEIKKIITESLKTKIKEFIEVEDMNKPFYFKLFSKKEVFTHALLQSIFTWFGGKWQNFAEIVAKPNFISVQKTERIEGEITPEERAKIDQILDSLDSGSREPNIERTKKELFDTYNETQSREKVSQQVDIIIKGESGTEYYFELKSVKPNKNEVKAAKRDLLKILAMRQKEKPIKKIHVYLTMPFNSYFSGNYRRWTVTKFFKLNEDLLVGENFWDFIGGKNTYENLLSLFSDVGIELMPQIQKTINTLVGKKTSIKNFTK